MTAKNKKSLGNFLLDPGRETVIPNKTVAMDVLEAKGPAGIGGK